MITPALITFIKSELQKGKDRDTIKAELAQGGGWSIVDIAEAFVAIDLEPKGIQPGVVASQIKKPHKTVRLIWVIVLMLLAGYTGWWVRDRQQFLQFPIPFVRS
jgi:hypothetical protein